MSELRRRVMGGSEPDIEPVNGSDDYIDLGLPSGTLWATCNVGSNTPEGYGLYFSWGDVTGYAEGSGHDFSQANYNATTVNGTFIKDISTNIQPDSGNDAARENWEEPWRMPTKEDYQELYDNTDSEWVDDYNGTGVAGRKFMKKSDHSVYVFFPAAGLYNGTSLTYRGTGGFYWSSSFNSATNAYGLDFYSSSVYPQNYYNRRLGFTVRPVTSTPPTKVIFKVTTTDGTSNEDVELTVKGTNIEYTVSTNAQGLVALILPDGNYTISSETHTLDTSSFVVTRNMVVDVRATKRVIETGYIILDQTQTGPTKKVVDENGKTYSTGFTRPSVIDSIRRDSHRYLGSYDNNTKVMKLVQLDDTDSTKCADGTDVSTDIATVGYDVWMKLPKFYTRATETQTDKWKIEFAYGGKPEGNGWKQWGGDDLIGAYEAYNSNSKLYSVSGVTSTGDVSQTNFKAYARSRGDGFTCVKWKHQNIMAILFYAYYGHTNCQSLIGSGADSNNKQTGLKNSLGMTDTTAANGNTDNIVFWGLENWWGNKYEWVDNVVINNHTWTITEDDGSTRTIQSSAMASGNSAWIYASKFILGNNLDVIAAAGQSGGSNSKGYCDGQQYTSEGSRVVLRSCDLALAYGGVALVLAHNVSSDTYVGSGSRLAYHGDIEIMNSYADYKYRGIDLGLPSGKIWSEVNIGASSAEQAGLYFSWGNTQGYAAGSGHNFSSATYSAKTDGKGVELTGDIPVSAEYDAAVKYCGGKWRMPTGAEYEELKTNCNLSWTTKNGINGALFTSKINGESIFFPLAGLFNSTELAKNNSWAPMWTSTHNDNTYSYMFFIRGDMQTANGDYGGTKSNGFPIRPIRLPHAVTLRLKDGSDNALSGVGITVSDSYGFVASVTTDSNGEGVFYCDSGTYSLSADGYLLNINSVEVTEDITVSLVGSQSAPIITVSRTTINNIACTATSTTVTLYFDGVAGGVPSSEFSISNRQNVSSTSYNSNSGVLTINFSNNTGVTSTKTIKLTIGNGRGSTTVTITQNADVLEYTGWQYRNVVIQSASCSSTYSTKSYSYSSTSYSWFPSNSSNATMVVNIKADKYTCYWYTSGKTSYGSKIESGANVTLNSSNYSLSISFTIGAHYSDVTKWDGITYSSLNVSNAYHDTVNNKYPIFDSSFGLSLSTQNSSFPLYNTSIWSTNGTETTTNVYIPSGHANEGQLLGTLKFTPHFSGTDGGNISLYLSNILYEKA